MDDLRAYSDTAFTVEEAYQLSAALNIIHRLRNKPMPGMSEESLAQRKALLGFVITILKRELVRAARDLSNRLTNWERTQPSG